MAPLFTRVPFHYTLLNTVDYTPRGLQETLKLPYFFKEKCVQEKGIASFDICISYTCITEKIQQVMCKFDI